ncbi:MAG: hypothetical protein ABIT76_11355 [Chthoniobacterales bacterium]
MKKSAATPVAFAASVALVFFAWEFYASAADVAPLDPHQILQELEDIQTKQKTVSSTIQKRNMDLVFKAAGSKEAAMALYEEALMATQFQGVNRENTQFRDWKKAHEEQLKNSDFRESVRLHLFYLGLSLRKAADAKPEDLVPQVSDYLRILDASWEAVDVKESLLKSSVSDGIFSKWLGLGPELAKAENWEMNPGKSDAIAAKYLLPQWRKQKNPALLSYWDARLAREAAVSGNAKLDFQEKNFATVRRPELLWQRSQELVVLDQPNRAAQEMFSLIKNYPNHPKITEWIATLQKLLQPESAPKAE